MLMVEIPGRRSGRRVRCPGSRDNVLPGHFNDPQPNPELIPIVAEKPSEIVGCEYGCSAWQRED